MNRRQDNAPSFGPTYAIFFALVALLALAAFAGSAQAHELTNAQDPNVAGDSPAHVQADAIDVRAGSRYLRMMKRIDRIARARARKRLALGLPAQRVELSDQGVRQRGFLQTVGFDVSLTNPDIFSQTSATATSTVSAGPTTRAAQPRAGGPATDGLWSSIIWPTYALRPANSAYPGFPGDPDLGNTNFHTGDVADPAGDTGTNPNPRIVPVFEALMPDGKVLFWDWLLSGYFNDGTPQMSTRILLWDPMSPNTPGQRLDVVGANLFCAGFAHLPNGDLFLAGGNANNQFHGLNDTYIYHWRSKSWEQGPDMSRLRWYPSVAALYNGEDLILGGDPPGGYGNPNDNGTLANRSVPEVYSAKYSDPSTQTFDNSQDSIRDLNNIRFGNDTSGPGGSDAVNPPSSRGYPFLVPSVDGRVLYAGYELETYLIDPTGAGSSQSFGAHDNFWRVNGSFVNYNTGKVLVVGGGTPAKYGDPTLSDPADEHTCSDTNLVGSAQCQPLPNKQQEHGASASSTYIDLLNDNWPEADQGKPGGPNGSFPHTSDMPTPRRFDYATALPDGKVLVTGGMSNTDPDPGDNAANDDYNNNLVNIPAAQKSALMLDPVYGTFTQLASAAVAREYHSTALLLPDGRVLTGGGGVCGPCTTQGNHYYNPNFEIFSPPYLFNTNGTVATRPAITNQTINDGGAQVLPPVDYNQSFDITYTQGVKDSASRDVATAALMKLGTPTHSTDTGQRFVPLDFQKDTANGVLHMKSPANSYIAPPGFYMLFLVDDSGTPSISRMIQVGANLALHNINSVVNVFQDAGFGGRAQYLGIGEFKQSVGNFANVGDRAISSIQVASGYQVTACTASNGTGCTTFGPGDFPSLPAGFDDSIRYMKVEPDTGTGIKPPTPPAGPTPPGPTPPTPPTVKVTTKLKAAKKYKFTATCPSGCSVTPTLNIGKLWLKLKGAKLNSSTKPTTVTVALTSKQYKTLKQGLKIKAKVTMWFTVTDGSNQKAEKSARIK